MCVCTYVASPVVVEAPRSRGVDILRNISLPCSALGKPKPSVTWSRSDGLPLTDTDRLTVHDDGSLAIHGQ